MFKVIKKQGKKVTAYRLGDEDPVLKKLIEERKVILLREGRFEVMSQEAVQGMTGHGQVAFFGDYVKIDSAGHPYPISKKWFEENHRSLGGNEYEQIPQPLDAWTVNEPMDQEVQFLLKEKGLLIDEERPSQYFSAPLWGTIEAAAKDAVIVFYSITRSENGEVEDAEFNFVERSEFEKTYNRI